WTLGFDKLAERVRDYSPERVEAITWIPKEAIVEAARTFATTKPSSIIQAASIEQNINPIATCRAIALLSAITGNLDVPGGNVFPTNAGQMSTGSMEFTLDLTLEEKIWRKRLGANQYPLISHPIGLVPPIAHVPSLWRALHDKTSPIRASFFLACNPLNTLANSNLIREALMRIDFSVAVDLFMTETASLADVVLPAATWLERNELADSFQATPSHLRLRQKIIEIQECWSDTKIILELARRLSLDHLFWESEETLLDYLLNPIGLSFGKLREMGGVVNVPMRYRKYEKEGFKTPSGKVEVWSSVLERYGYDPLPGHVDSGNEPTSEYPLILVTGRRARGYFHSEGRNIPSLRRLVPEPELDIHPETAKNYGVSHGAGAYVKTRLGKIGMKANVTRKTHPRVVHVPHGWSGDANVNRIIDDGVCSPDTGTVPLRGMPCAIENMTSA
ncbi:MAG: molybdopterin-dependent oxidoreductase, partial [Candidatus Bathyarchaeia archaeon]